MGGRFSHALSSTQAVESVPGDHFRGPSAAAVGDLRVFSRRGNSGNKCPACSFSSGPNLVLKLGRRETQTLWVVDRMRTLRACLFWAAESAAKWPRPLLFSLGYDFAI